MSSERRALRPFQIDPRLNGLFDESVLQFGPNKCAAGGQVSVGEDFERCAVWLHWVDPGSTARDRFRDWQQSLREGVIGTGLTLEDTCVVVTARSGYLKLNSVVFTHSLDDLIGLKPKPRLDVAGAQRHEVFRYSTHGVIVDAYVALARTLRQRRPLVPWRAGSWLTHARFRVRCPQDTELFRPRSLDQVERARLHLPAEALSYAEFEGKVTDLDNAEVCTYWVDKELLEAIDKQSALPAAKVLQRWLFADFLSAVIHQYRDEAAGSSMQAGAIDELRESLIGRVVRMLASQGASDEELTSLFGECRRNSNLVVARIQHAGGLRKAAIESLKGGDG